jgi:regulator of RNase E activity RraA
MNHPEVSTRFERLSTPLVADAHIRLGLHPRIAPGGIRPLVAGSRICGPAAPVVLTGYADRVLEGIYRARRGDVLVLDNQGREKEACFGDLAAYEARSQGLAGVVIWGRHRDSTEVVGIGVPVFSYGTYALGLQHTYEPIPDPFARCEFGAFGVEPGDLVFADDDGLLFVPAAECEKVLKVAEELGASEKTQVDRILAGITLREQLKFDDYLRDRQLDPTLTLGEHLKRIGRHF